MKALKIIGIIVGVLVAAILIIPLFLPATAEINSEIEIALEPSQVFPFVASYENREAWDPWVAMDSTTVVTVEPKPGYVGSSFSWEGERLGSGRMEVVAVTGNKKIDSKLWFGDMEIPSQVHWDFEKVEGGTLATWSYSQETPYPFSRLGMVIGKGIMKHSFDTGLSKLKEYLEANPPLVSPLGPITIETQQPFHALVAKGGGTVEAIGEQFQMLYSKVWEELAIQELHVAGPEFANYLDYDQAGGDGQVLPGDESGPGHPHRTLRGFSCFLRDPGKIY
jgi:uncharacterized protein YndB with AHSA1/START domain